MNNLKQLWCCTWRGQPPTTTYSPRPITHSLHNTHFIYSNCCTHFMELKNLQEFSPKSVSATSTQQFFFNTVSSCLSPLLLPSLIAWALLIFEDRYTHCITCVLFISRMADNFKLNWHCGLYIYTGTSPRLFLPHCSCLAEPGWLPLVGILPGSIRLHSHQLTNCWLLISSCLVTRMLVLSFRLRPSPRSRQG